jgi:DNA polymerase-1
MSDRTLVASATNLLARGYLVVPTDRVTRDGAPANGLFAVARAIHRVMAFKTPARAIAVIDSGAPDPKWPPLLAAQLPRLAELLTTLGLHVVHAEGEVHVVASYAAAALARGDDAIIVGVDKRYAQLVGDRLWWYDANKDARYTDEIVRKRFGVGPAQVGEWLGLVGDDDALPGVTGIGAKGATTLLETYGTVAAALDALDGIKGRLGNALRAVLRRPRRARRAAVDHRDRARRRLERHHAVDRARHREQPVRRRAVARHAIGGHHQVAPCEQVRGGRDERAVGHRALRTLPCGRGARRRRTCPLFLHGLLG